MTVLFATGGTGGHVFPALAVAQALEAKGVTSAFIGQQGGMEERLVGSTDFAFYGARAGKWDRSRPDPRQALRALLGLKDAHKIVKALRPELVTGFGGFASFPGLVAGLRLGVPIIMHEQNVFPGRVTRWLQSHAQFIATAQSEVAKRLPKARKLIQVGLPVREERVAKEEARARLGLPQRGKLVWVMGGSQGSLFLNRHVPAAFRALLPELKQSLTVLHSSGPRWEADVKKEVADLPGYDVRGFVEAPLAWSAADIAITRAGASTIAEAAFHGVPLLMVPLPSAAEDHQRFNALAVQSAGAGVVVLEQDANLLVSKWQGFLDDRVLEAASQAARRRSPEGAADRLAELIIDAFFSVSQPRGAQLEALKRS